MVKAVSVLGWGSVAWRGQYSLMLPAGLLLRREYLEVRERERLMYIARRSGVHPACLRGAGISSDSVVACMSARCWHFFG
jgi:hypothetical protein